MGYNEVGETRTPYIVGLAGGTACGKTTVARAVIDGLGVRWVAFLSMDSFYLDLPEGTDPATYDFDSPAAMDWELMLDVLSSLREGRAVQVPVYDFTTNSRLHSTPLYGADVVIFEGLFTLYDERVRNILDLKIYVDADPDVRLSRRLRRDRLERGRSVPSILTQYETFVKPAFHAFIEPTMKFADIILPYGADSNAVGVDLIVKTIRTTLTERGVPFREKIRGAKIGNDDFDLLPPSYHQLEGKQVKALLTILRNRDTGRDEFVFTAHRLTRLLIEEAMSYLPMDNVTITTPTGATYEGTRPAAKICGVSIIRAGEAMEKALREVAQDVRIGKILIQTSKKTKQPQLFFKRLPADISSRCVLLMDPVIGTGATAMMAIRLLLDHGVEPSNIIFLCLIAAVPAIVHLAYTFPDITIVAADLDDLVDEKFYVRPGIGNFGARYFGDRSSDVFGSKDKGKVQNGIHIPNLPAFSGMGIIHHNQRTPMGGSPRPQTLQPRACRSTPWPPAIWTATTLPSSPLPLQAPAVAVVAAAAGWMTRRTIPACSCGFLLHLSTHLPPLRGKEKTRGQKKKKKKKKKS